tara:strand:- start:22 stop:651 length:630 start_codon:yes stop_codon:yes gene_type:complete
MQEVSDEVRRDKLFGFFRRYAWIGIGLVLLLVGAAGVNEYRKSQQKLVAELNGDQLREVLENYTESADFEQYYSYLEKDLAGKPLAVLNQSFLISPEGNSKKSLGHLNAVAGNSKLPIVLRDLATLYEVYVFGSEIEGKMDRLNALSGPDRPYRILAMEAKVDSLIGDNAFEDALGELDLIEASLSPSSETSSRIKNLRQIIQSKISSD